MPTRVKSGKFGQSSKFGQRPWFFHFWMNGIKIKLIKQTVKILMRRLIKSRIISIFNVCKCMSEFTLCQKLPDFTLVSSADNLKSDQAWHNVQPEKDPNCLKLSADDEKEYKNYPKGKELSHFDNDRPKHLGSALSTLYPPVTIFVICSLIFS